MRQRLARHRKPSVAGKGSGPDSGYVDAVTTIASLEAGDGHPTPFDRNRNERDVLRCRVPLTATDDAVALVAYHPQ
jgi:hypothetical protein